MNRLYNWQGQSLERSGLIRPTETKWCHVRRYICSHRNRAGCDSHRRHRFSLCCRRTQKDAERRCTLRIFTSAASNVPREIHGEAALAFVMLDLCFVAELDGDGWSHAWTCRGRGRRAVRRRNKVSGGKSIALQCILP